MRPAGLSYIRDSHGRLAALFRIKKKYVVCTSDVCKSEGCRKCVSSADRLPANASQTGRHQRTVLLPVSSLHTPLPSAYCSKNRRLLPDYTSVSHIIQLFSIFQTLENSPCFLCNLPKKFESSALIFRRFPV